MHVLLNCKHTARELNHAMSSNVVQLDVTVCHCLPVRSILLVQNLKCLTGFDWNNYKRIFKSVFRDDHQMQGICTGILFLKSKNWRRTWLAETFQIAGKELEETFSCWKLPQVLVFDCVAWRCVLCLKRKQKQSNTKQKLNQSVSCLQRSCYLQVTIDCCSVNFFELDVLWSKTSRQEVTDSGTE